jgi:uncharacterized protein YecE (DUF72 family)
MAHLYIGTSGWVYRSWKGPFYPDTLPSRRYLAHYAQEFETTEINSSFYHLPRASTFTNWAEQVPEDFIFAVKASRFLTHIKRLLDPEEPWQRFIESAVNLGSRLGPILLQFPPSFKIQASRLETFFNVAQAVKPRPTPLKLVCEFRHESWFHPDIYRLLNRYHVAWCIADGAKYPRKDLVTTDFAYIRYHGRSKMFASNYSKAVLLKEARLIKQHLRDGLDVFVYFNNDAQANAVRNARLLKRVLAAMKATATA